MVRESVILSDLVAESMMGGVVTNLNWTSITNQIMYRYHSSKFPLTKVELDFGASLNHTWKKLCLPVHDHYTRESLFLLIHNKLPTRERLFRIGIEKDPYCISCMKDFGCVICDREHMFSTCVSVSEIWKSIRRIIDPLLPENVECIKLLTLNFNGGSFATEVSWLMGSYVHEVWRQSYVGDGKINHDELFGFLKFKFKQDQEGARMKMSSIPNFT